MQKRCPKCKRTLIRIKYHAEDFKLFKCDCGNKYIYNNTTKELIKIEPRIKA